MPGTETAPVIETEPGTTEAKTNLASFIGEDGSLKEGWTKVFLDEDLRDEKSLTTFKNIKDPFKSFYNTKKMVGANTVKIPTDTSTETEWNAFYDSIGRPKTPADYIMKRPDDLPEEYWNPEFAKSAQELFHKIGLTPKQAQALFKFNTENVLNTLKEDNIATEAASQELKQELFREWGSAYDQKVHLGNCAIEEGTEGNIEFKERLLEKVNADPDLIKFAANIGSKFAEHKGPNFGAIPTPSDIKSQITTLEQNPLYLKGTQSQRMAIANQLLKLREKLVKTRTI